MNNADREAMIHMVKQKLPKIVKEYDFRDPDDWVIVRVNIAESYFYAKISRDKIEILELP